MNPINRLLKLRSENDLHIAIMAEQQDRFETIRARHDNGTAPRAISAFNLFQTPPELAARMAAEIDPSASRILEPSAGLGNLWQAARNVTNTAQIDLIEINQELSGELYNMTHEDNSTLRQRDFLEVEPQAIYDHIIMNPPFKMRRDIKHILHAQKFLKPGGKLIALCMAGRIREEKLQPLCTSWQPIPAGAFKASGTNIETIFLTITN